MGYCFLASLTTEYEYGKMGLNGKLVENNVDNVVGTKKRS